MSGSVSGRALHRPRSLRRSGVVLDAGTFLTIYLVALFALRAELVVPPLGSLGRPAVLLSLVGAVGWAFHQVHRPHADGRPVPPVRIALLGLVAAFAVSYVVALRRPISDDELSTATVGIVTAVGWLGVALVAADGLSTRELVDRVADRLVIAAMLLAALGVAQFLTHDLLWADLRFGLRELTPQAGLGSRNGFARPAGTATHPIEFGAVLTLVLPLALTRAKFAQGPSRHLWWLGVVLMGLGVVTSISRSSLLCATVGLAALAVVWRPAARRLLLLGVVLLVGAVAVVVPGLLGTLQGLFATADQDSSVVSRTGSYGIAGEFFGRSPWFGRGFSTFLPRYRIFDNEYLLLVVDVGLVGLVAFVVLLVVGMHTARRARWLFVDTRSQELAQAVFAGLLAAALGLALYDGLSFGLATGVLFVMLGLSGALHRLAVESRTTGDATAPGRATPGPPPGPAPGQELRRR